MGKIYITTAIPYVNGEPHIGHSTDLLYADVVARYARSNGDEVVFSTGTDEHGGKIADKAKELGLTNKELVDQMSEKFKQFTADLNISNNRFIRTTDLSHEERAQLIWKALKDDIYKGKYVGWYCTGCESFYTETEVKNNNGICPLHNKPYDKIEEENYFFKLSKYTTKINKEIESDRFKITPVTRKNEILSLLKKGLDDISISRPKENISWGIPVPGDKTQVMYVWFEALMNYLTVLGYPENQDFKDYWPAKVQVIGKDIIRFHAAIWPAMLMALNLPLPKNLFVHGFITVEGQKMSKSIGNVIKPKDIIDKYDVDTFRYYFLRHVPAYDDGDFSWSRLEAVYNSELANELGNVLQRTITLVNKYFDGKLTHLPKISHDIQKYMSSIEDFRFDQALEEVWLHIRGLNQYIDEEKPWILAKEDNLSHLEEVLGYQVSSLLNIAELLQPFMPDTADKINAIIHDPKSGADTILFPRTITSKK